MGPLTERILHAFDGGAGTDAQILAQFARTTGAAEPGIEAVLGALDQASVALPLLRTLSSSGAVSGPLSQSLQVSADLLADVYRIGVGHTLQIIDDLSHGRQGAIEPINQVIDALPAAASRSIATLNYDGLLPSQLIGRADTHYDLAQGWGNRDHLVVDGKSPISAVPLREFDNMLGPDLINLHGSIGWLRHQTEGWWRFKVDELRSLEYWKALRENRTEWIPAVVLTNQQRKSEIVGLYPFSLAYEAFRKRLANCERLAIIGYGFRDLYLNQVIASVLSKVRQKPNLLVVTQGHYPSEADIRTALRLESAYPLALLSNGVVDAIRTTDWQSWKSDS